METKHTALPWIVAEFFPLEVRDKNGQIICTVSGAESNISSLADAAFIVKACNSHYDLLNACKAMVGDDMPEAGQPGHIDYGKAVEMARAAIAKAEA